MLSTTDRRSMVEWGHPRIRLNRQCELLHVSKDSFYYKPVMPDSYNLVLMDLIDRKYTEAPFYGSRRMTAWPNRQGHPVNRKRVQRLMRVMGIEAICPKPNLSRRRKDHKVYPYLLDGVKITSPDHVWSTYITYVRVDQGFVYLTAVIENTDQRMDRLATGVEATVGDVRNLLAALDGRFETLSRDITATSAAARNALRQVEGTLSTVDGLVADNSGIPHELSETLRELAAAARSVRMLADYLEQYPDALIRGKKLSGGNP